MPTTTQQQWVTPLQAALSAAGVSSQDADALCQEFGQADPARFVEGLHWLAQSYVDLKATNLALPTEEPWAHLAPCLQNVAPGDIDDALRNALAQEPVHLQTVLLTSITAHAQLIQAQTVPQKKKRHPKSAEYLSALTDLGYAFRMNVLDDTIEVFVNGLWQPISDPVAALIRRQMRDKGYEYVNIMEDVYISEAYQNRYHPILDYLDSLQYDGGAHIARLATYFTDKDGAFPVFVRRWLIGAVAKARKAEQNRMLVLDGPQNLGKSYFTKWLGSVTPGYRVEGPIITDDKDAFVRLAGKWVWEVSEFGNTIRKSDREGLKYFLTMHTVTVRRSYGKFDMVKPALASFIGTFNNEGGVLNDPTGSRRFMVCKLSNINWAYAKDLDPHQVWAEANAAFLAGEPWTLTEDEISVANQINERYEIDDPIEGLLHKFFTVDPADRWHWTPTDEILTTLESNGLKGGSTRQNAMALSSVMTKIGAERDKRRRGGSGGPVWGYVGVKPV